MIKLFDTNGKAYPATIIHCEPNKVLEVKTQEKHQTSGYKVGYKETKENKLSKPALGIFKKVNAKPMQHIRTFTNYEGDLKVGDAIGVDSFTVGQYVDVQGYTRGRGFTGAIARWNFKIGPLGHGAGYPHRLQGSIAMGRGGSQAQRVAKGKKMHGHYGDELVTMQNLIVLMIRPKDNLIVVSGSIPGPSKGVVVIKTSYKKPETIVKLDLISKQKLEQIIEENEKLEDKDALHEANQEAEKEEAAELAAEEKEKEAARKAKEAEEKAAAAKAAAEEKAKGGENK